MQRVLVHEKKHEIGRWAAYLITDAAAADGEKERCAPLFAARAASGHPAAVIAAENEGEFQLAGNNRDALSLIEQARWNALIGRVHDFVEDLIGVVDAVDGIVFLRGHGCKCGNEGYECDNDSAF